MRTKGIYTSVWKLGCIKLHSFILVSIFALGVIFIAFSVYKISAAENKSIAYDAAVEESVMQDMTGTPIVTEVEGARGVPNAPNLPKSEDTVIHGNDHTDTEIGAFLPAISGPTEVLYKKRPSIGDTIGTLTMPKLKKSLTIIHGTDPDELDKGVGHYAGSVLPGENDNSVLSGHRDSVFRGVGKLKKGDLLIVETTIGVFTYQIRGTKIVEGTDRTVIVPTDKAILTLSTCYPFEFVGTAPDRYIITAELVQSRIA